MVLGMGLILLSVASFILGVLTSATAILSLLPAISGVKAAVLLLLYVYTPELYPTNVRSTALGMFSAFQRVAPVVGHYVSPFYLLAFSVDCLRSCYLSFAYIT